jgi:hypothetical protein
LAGATFNDGDPVEGRNPFGKEETHCLAATLTIVKP